MRSSGDQPSALSRSGNFALGTPGALMGGSASTCETTRELDARILQSAPEPTSGRIARPSHAIAAMRILAIDCSTEALSVAAGDAVDTTHRHGHAGQSHSQLALAWIDEVLAERGWRTGDLEGIAFGAGPGTFTGIRIACGIAQGLALGAGIAVVAVPTLEAIAQQAWRLHGATRVLACLDARMREVYVAAYERSGDSWFPQAVPAVTKPGDVDLPAGEWFGAGGGFAAYPELAALKRLSAVDASLEPTASSIVELAARRLRSGEGVGPGEALPLYVRHRVALTSAERAAGERL